MERKKLGNCLGCKPINRKRLGKLPWLLREKHIEERKKCMVE